ncbi:hypothetical protein OFY17_06330 [Marinomonas sp. C2222]|uniref:Uncharacterized protein n=1 Tax=Marinomonas sargassi TaxID=2984494 RepID=A0ABT2YRI3_9GAMM|nr:hypothetical protein [Marinomonas sargassi]MCV2402507.1 hypothetical protein [Marinomonas sargassi]
MEKKIELRLGEQVMPEAPVVELSNGELCIPQHYLTYHHTLESVEALICSIDYDPRYLIFAAQDDSCIYIQVGVVGHDNYKKSDMNNDSKLLFGRKWRVEPELPTSEIIQTVFLAIKKAREHEVRELFKLNIQDSITTPFNTHIDLPLMAEFYTLNRERNEHKKASSYWNLTALERVEEILSCISYDDCQFKLIHLEQRANGLWLIDLEIHNEQGSHLSEAVGRTLYLQVNDLSLNLICREIMQELIRISDAHVDAHFSYKGFHRFDPSIEITEVAHLSQQTRKVELAEDFERELIKNNYLTDQMRIPPLKQGPLTEKYREVIERFGLYRYEQ